MPNHDLVAQADSLLSMKDDRRLKSFLARLKPQEIARVINRLGNGKRKTFAMLPPEVQAETVIGLSEQSKTFVLPRLTDHVIARFIHFCEEDDAADIIQFLPEERRQDILKHVKGDKKLKLEKLLTFHPETAGGLMDLNFMMVSPKDSLKEVSNQLKQHVSAHKQTPTVIVTNEAGKAAGFIPHKSLILPDTDKTAEGAMHSLTTLSHETDQEKVLKLATRQKIDVFGVVDDKDKFLGVIHLRDLLKIAQMEATEDVFKFAGVSPEEEMFSSARVAVRMRYKWLILNLATAFLASFVVSLFQDTIGLLPILAVYMPIVAGMGGNAGTQTLAVAVRGLAVGEVTRRQRRQLIIKEILTGLTNGIINGVIVAAGVYLLTQNLRVGIILGTSMIINMVVAGIFGVIIPITLKALKIDPAVASSVFVTTATDVFGFLTFLGLATWFLL